MKVAIHQPNYLPYIGYFSKMAQADIFVILDNVQFSKDSYTQRTRIRTKEGSIWLTIPVEKKNNSFKLIQEVQLPQNRKWLEKHRLSIISNYSKTPFYDETFIRTYYDSYNSILLRDFNEFGIYYLKNIFGIKTKIIRSSELNLNRDLKATDLLIDIIKKIGGTTYISGHGGKKYLDENKFPDEGIKLVYFEFEPFEYKQRWNGFEPYMSAIDLLFNLGDQSEKLFADSTI